LALAPVRRAQGALDDAERLYDEAIPKFRALGGAGTGLAAHLNNHAFLLRTRGEFARAEPPYREALNILTALHGRGHPNSLLVATNLAAVLDELGDLAGAEAVLRENLEAAKAQWPDSHWRVGAQHEALGGVLLRRRQWDKGLTHLGEARDVYREVLGARHLWTFFAEATTAAGHVARGRADLGQPYLDRFYQYRVEDLRQPGDHAAQRDLIDVLTPFVRLLEGFGLDREAARFGALLSPADPSAGEPTG
jgi:tetratricopeptide (TPR) repeat protein